MVEEHEINIVDYLNILRKRLLLIIISTLAVITLVSLYIYSLEDEYSATTKVLFEHSNPAANIVNQPYYFYTQKIVPEIEKEMILNSKIVGAVVDELKLTAEPPGSMEWYAKVAKIASYIRINFLDTQQANVFYGSRMLANIVTITPDPQLSKDILTSLVEHYQKDQMKYKIEKDRNVRLWLDEQLKEAKSKIEESEQRFQKFKQEREILSMKELQQTQVENLTVFEKDYNTAIRERKNIQVKLESLKEALNMDKRTSNIVFGTNEFPTVQKYVAQLNDLEVERNNALKTFLDKHPVVVDINENIMKTEEKIEQAKLDIIKSLRIQLETAIDFEEMKKKDMDIYKAKAMEVSQDTLQYQLLEREVESSKQLYDLLATQLKETTVQNSVTIVDLRVIEPPLLPRKPISKKYPTKISVAALIGLVFGIIISFLMEYIDLSIKSPDEVKHYLSLPVAGIIPHIETTFDEGRIEELTNLMVRNYEEQV
ncbi:GumC family protein [bacterium]|nr:GumC family protein [bacterium]